MKKSPNEMTLTERMAPGVLSKDGFLGDDDRPLDEIIERDRVSLFAGVPTMYFALLHHEAERSHDLGRGGSERDVEHVAWETTVPLEPNSTVAAGTTWTHIVELTITEGLPATFSSVVEFCIETYATQTMVDINSTETQSALPCSFRRRR